MTEAKPCLPGCYRAFADNEWHHMDACPNAAPKASEAEARGACMEWDPSCDDCLRASPPPEEPAPAPEPTCDYCHHPVKVHFSKGCGSCLDLTFPRCTRTFAAPEPKQGSEEIDWQRAEGVANSIVCEMDHHYEGDVMLARAQLALRAQLAAAQVEIKSLKFEKEAFREAHAEKDRALAAAREEIAAWTKDSNDAREAFAAEKARADRAEERVMELEDLIAAKSEGDSYRDNDGCLPARLKGRGREPMRVQHRTVWIVEILVERKYENRYEATVGCSLTRDGAKELIKVWRANCPSDKFKIAKYRKEGR